MNICSRYTIIFITRLLKIKTILCVEYTSWPSRCITNELDVYFILYYNIIRVLRIRNLKSNPAYSRKPLTLKRRSAAGPLYSWQKGTFFLEADAESYIALYIAVSYIIYIHYRTLATYIIILSCTPAITSSPRGYWFGLIFM